MIKLIYLKESLILSGNKNVNLIFNQKKIISKQ